MGNQIVVGNRWPAASWRNLVPSFLQFSRCPYRDNVSTVAVSMPGNRVGTTRARDLASSKGITRNGERSFDSRMKKMEHAANRLSTASVAWWGTFISELEVLRDFREAFESQAK